jgi:hypothetical protein
MKTRLLVLLVLALAATLAPAGSPASAAPAAPAAPPAPPAGTYLALVEQGKPTEFGGIVARTQRLVVVSTTGERRVVYTHRASHRYGGARLEDWSTDGSTALLVTQTRKGSRLIRVDVTTGAVLRIATPPVETAVLDPAGTGVLASVWNARSERWDLARVDWTGTSTVLRRTISGTLLAGRDGTVLTTDGRNGHQQLLVSVADGSLVTSFRTPYCVPVRWWDATRTLQTCSDNDLHLVDPTTGADTRLTHGHGPGDYGHLDARSIGSRRYVQVAGACGYTYVARETRTTSRHLRVPGAVGNVVMVDAVGTDLVLEHAASCDGARPRPELSLFDPVHHAETPFLTLGRHEAFETVLVLGEARATNFS